MKVSFKNITQALLFKLLIINGLVVVSCSKQAAPSGGEKDVIAPKLLATAPPDQSTNYQESELIFLFDEYIQFSGGEDKVLISPPITPAPEFRVRGKKLEAKIIGGLQPNTTYSIQIYGAVKDYTEGNIANNLSLTFSTGNELDTLQITGKALDAQTLDPVADYLVLVNPVENESLVYLAKTNAQGDFLVPNLKNGAYNLTVLKDQNFNKSVDESESVGMLQSTVQLNANLELTEAIKTFTPKKALSVKSTKELEKGHLLFVFNSAATQLALDASFFLPEDIAYLNQSKDTLHYWYHSAATEGEVYIGLEGNTYDTVRINLKQTEIASSFGLEKDFNEDHPRNLPITIIASQPISKVVTDSILITDTSGQIIPFQVEVADYINLNLTANLQKAQHYSLQIKSGAIQGFKGSINETLNQSFHAAAEVNKASIIINTDHEASPLVVLLYQDGILLESKSVSKETKTVFGSLSPGTYELRLFIDSNNNGEWDGGNYFTKTEPEQTLNAIKNIEVVSGWDKEIDFSQ